MSVHGGFLEAPRKKVEADIYFTFAVEDLTSGSSDCAANSWVTWFLSTKGNEYFCEVDEDYVLDRFNLTGLNGEVQHYPQALDLVTDALGEHIL